LFPTWIDASVCCTTVVKLMTNLLLFSISTATAVQARNAYSGEFDRPVVELDNVDYVSWLTMLLSTIYRRQFILFSHICPSRAASLSASNAPVRARCRYTFPFLISYLTVSHSSGTPQFPVYFLVRQPSSRGTSPQASSRPPSKATRRHQDAKHRHNVGTSQAV